MKQKLQREMLQKEELVREAKRQYFREYRLRYPEKAKEAQAKFWNKRAELLELRMLEEQADQQKEDHTIN